MFISGVCFREVKKEMERTYKLDLQSINDAKSMFGLLNMSHCKPLETTIYSNDENEINEFAKICKRYEVKKND